MLKLQMQYLHAENLPQFSIGEIGDEEELFVCKVVENGAILSDAYLLPSTVMFVKYKNQIIGKIDIQYYLHDICSFDYESNSFKVQKYKNVSSVENIWNDVRQSILEMKNENDVINVGDFDYEYDEVFFISYKNYNNEKTYRTYIVSDGRMILVDQDSQYTTTYAPNLCIFPNCKSENMESEKLYHDSVGVCADALYNEVINISQIN